MWDDSEINYSRIREGLILLLARRLVNGRERGCLQVVSCSVLRLVNMSTRAMRLKAQARALACLQVVYLTLSVVKEQSLSASLVRLEKELFPLYLLWQFTGNQVPYSPGLPHPTANSQAYTVELIQKGLTLFTPPISLLIIQPHASRCPESFL